MVINWFFISLRVTYTNFCGGAYKPRFAFLVPERFFETPSSAIELDPGHFLQLSSINNFCSHLMRSTQNHSRNGIWLEYHYPPKTVKNVTSIGAKKQYFHSIQILKCEQKSLQSMLRMLLVKECLPERWWDAPSFPPLALTPVQSRQSRTWILAYLFAFLSSFSILLILTCYSVHFMIFKRNPHPSKFRSLADVRYFPVFPLAVEEKPYI